MANCKTAVSILQEHCARQGMTPIYSTISQEGRSHQPKFTISCTAGTTTGTGEGVSKKSAKQAAAEAVLQQWEVEIPKLDSVKAEAVDTPNPVGELQELVTFLGWRRPEYEEIEETGPPHDRSFVVGVTVGKFKEKGSDKSKRLAKRTAAKAMLETIKSLPPDTDPGIEPGTTKPKKKQAALASKVTACTLQNAVGPNIERLCNNQLDFPDPTAIKENFDPPSRKNPVQMLNEMNVAPVEFEVVRKDGPPHDPMYVLSVQVDGKTFEAQAKKKQMGKELLARRALFEVFGIASSNGDTLPDKKVQPTPSILYTKWKGATAYTWADHIQKIIEQKLRQVTFNVGQMKYIKYKVLAGIVQSDGDNMESAKVVCLATGTKCPLAEDPDTKGKVVYDCHAEVVAHRCLKRYLLGQLRMYQKDPESSIFVDGSSGILQIKESIQFHLYISCPPCGDAASFIKEARSMGAGDIHPHRGARGILRAKIKQGESTIPLTGKAITAPERLFAMTCSDKVASWNVLGIQGALLSHLVAPVYLSSVVLGIQCHPDHLPRALYGRLTDLPSLPTGYKLNKPLMVATTMSGPALFGISPSSKSPNFSINWILNDGTGGIEVITTDKGLTKDGLPSRISKQKLFSAYMDIIYNPPNNKRSDGRGSSSKQRQKKGGNSSKGKPSKQRSLSLDRLCQVINTRCTYREAKNKAAAYQECKKVLKSTFLFEGLGRWLVKSKICDDFRDATNQQLTE